MKTLKRRMPRAVSLLTTLALILALVPATVSPSLAIAQTYAGDGFSVNYTTNHNGGNNYAVECNITNTSAETLSNWVLGFAFDGDITNIWSSSVYSNLDRYAIIQNAGWNSNISPNASVNFGFQYTSNNGDAPENFDLLQPTLVPIETATATTNILENASNFMIQITVTNNGATALNGWTVGFDFAGEITNVDSGNLVSQDGRHAVICDAGWNANIAPGASVTATLIGNGNADFTGFAVYQTVYTRPSENANHWDSLDWEDPDEDGLPNWQEEYFNTNPNNPDTDGDGILDGLEVQFGTDPLVDDANLDYDGDGLTNADEILIHHTDVWSADTDGDGLSDGDEVTTTYGSEGRKTDPLKKDTDADGLSDGTEVRIGIMLTDPTLPDTGNQGLLDGEKTFTQTFNFDVAEDVELTPQLSITGRGEINFSAEESHNKIFDLPYVVGMAYDFTHEEDLDFDTSTLSFTLSDEALQNNALESLSIVSFDEETGSFDYLETEILDDNTIIAHPTHYSIYLVVNGEKYLVNKASYADYQSDLDLSKYDAIGAKLGGHYYALLDCKVGIPSFTWTEAEAFCRSMGGHLVTITSASEQTAVEGLFSRSLKQRGYWLGASDAEIEGQWRWVTGESWGYTHWKVGEPNNAFNGAEDYLGFWQGTFWNDFTNDAQATGISNMGLICEWDSEEPYFKIQLTSGKVIYLLADPEDPNSNADTDGDGIPDKEELLEKVTRWIPSGPNSIPVAVEQWTYKSDPSVKDTDGDGLEDGEDPLPLQPEQQVHRKTIFFSGEESSIDFVKYNPDSFFAQVHVRNATGNSDRTYFVDRNIKAYIDNPAQYGANSSTIAVIDAAKSYYASRVRLGTFPNYDRSSDEYYVLIISFFSYYDAIRDQIERDLMYITNANIIISAIGGGILFNRAVLAEGTLAQKNFDNVLRTKIGSRPNPETYLSQEYIATHQAQFNGGVTKFIKLEPSGIIGNGQIYVIPKSTADRLAQEAAGDVSYLERALGFNPGELGANPVRVDIASPQNLHMSTGNESGANDFWLPGGYTSGGLPEAIISPVSPAEYTWSYVWGK